MKKVLMLNGSPKADGNTATALNVLGKSLKENGVDFEVVQIGSKNIRGCIDCRYCFKEDTRGICVFDDGVNEIVSSFANYDGIVLSSPTYYAGMNGTMKSFLDRAFRLNGTRGNLLRGKVSASVAAVRRAGSVPVMDSLNYYLQYCETFMVGSTYWNMAFGREPKEVLKDVEGMNTMENLGSNMAFLIKALDGKVMPKGKDKVWMHFIREGE